MPAIARANDEHILFLPGLAIVVLARVQDRSGEIAQCRNIWKIRNTADAGGQNHVPRVYLARRAVGVTKRDRPLLHFVVVATALEFGRRPVVELHAFGVGFKPAGNFVFGNVGRPGRRETHIGKVIDVHLIMQNEGVIALAPVVADPRFAIDDQRIDAQLSEARGD